MKRGYAFSLLIMMVVSALVVMTASAEGAWAVDWWTMDGGGGASSDGVTYTLDGTIGQPDAGKMSGGAYELTGGFWGGGVRNRAPTDISLSNNEITEAQPVNTTVGSFTTVDPDPGDSFTYALVTADGCLGGGNSLFWISGPELQSQAELDYEAQSTHDICVRTNDGHGHTYDESFAIQVLNAENMVTTVASTGSKDGWVRAATADNLAGGTLNSVQTTILLGDEAANRQYRSIVSFSTAALPDNAVVSGVTLRLRLQGMGGINPFDWPGNGLLVDAHPLIFGAKVSLEKTDFEFAADYMALGSIPNTSPLPGDWYSVELPASVNGFDYVSTTGVTQLRLRFDTPTNTDGLADRIKLFSGNSVKASRPQLIVHYAIPSAILNFKAAGGYDGWLRENPAIPGTASALNTANTTVLVGDDLLNRQYRAVLSFDTSALPEMALMNSVTLKLKQQSVKGTPFDDLGELWLDVQKPHFGAMVKLQYDDFGWTASDEAAVSLPVTPDGTGWYVVTIPAAAFDSINVAGTTQFRLRFNAPTDNDSQLDQVRLFSANALASQRPVLIIDYEVP